MLVNSCLTKLKSMERFGINESRLSNIFLSISEVSVTKRTLLIEDKDIM